MYELRQTDGFRRWLQGVPDPTTQARLVRRLERLAAGNAGDHRPLGLGLHELRVHSGPGYRIYYAFVGNRLIFLLAGGDKSTQARDVARARSLMKLLGNVT